MTRLRILLPFAVFCLYFVSANRWPVPSELVIQGTAGSGAHGIFRWDSGSGYNRVEEQRVALSATAPSDSQTHTVTIRRTGKRNPLAGGSEVKISRIRVGDRILGIHEFDRPPDVQWVKSGHLALLREGAEFSFAVRGDRPIEILFGCSPMRGLVSIGVDGDTREYDLYAETSVFRTVIRGVARAVAGPFTAVIPLPRYDMRRCRLELQEAAADITLQSAILRSGDRETALPLARRDLYIPLDWEDLPPAERLWFHPLQLPFQILFAALCTAAVAWATGRLRDDPRGMRHALLGEGRWLFWILFAGAAAVFSAWWLAFWPGYLTSDSIHVWWAARQPGFFIHAHPFLNVVYYRFLQHLWNNVAVVPLFQILATAALGSAIFTTIHRRGVPLLLLMPWYAFFVLSVPIGLYTISLWKDVPFALLVLLWAFYLAQRVFLGKEPVDQARSGRELGWYLLALAGIGLFRYNGLVYLFFIPLGFVLFRLVSVRRALMALAVLAVAGAVNLAALAGLDKGDYFFGSIRFFAHRLQEEPPARVLQRMARQYPELMDINSYKRTGTWYDIWYRNPVFIAIHEDFTRESGYNLHVRHQEVKPMSGRIFKWLNRIAHGSYQEPWVWFTWNPYYLLFLAPLCCLPWWFPSTAAFGYVIFVQVLTLMLVLGPYNYNWRYYYFFYLSLPFFVPMALMDSWRCRNLKRG